MSDDNVKILAVEDGPFQAEMLSNKLISGGYEVIGPFGNGEEAIAFIEKLDIKPDAAILDIEIEGNFDGIETAKILYNKYGIPIIFLSHLQDENTRARLGEVPAIFYSKSDNLINEIALFDAIDRSVNSTQERKVKSGPSEKIDNLKTVSLRNVKRIIDVDSISWIEADGQVAYIYLAGEDKKYIAKGTLKETEAKLDTHPNFVRISKSCIINLNFVDTINGNHINEDGKRREVVELKNSSVKINIGREYKKHLNSLIEDL